jgi:signal transduction histidine kinase
LNLSFRNRISAYYLFATALIIALIFITIYFIVHKTVYSHLKDDLDSELKELNNSIVIYNDSEIVFANPFEWEEGEHRQIEVNPTFIQVSDKFGKSVKKTSNLLNDSLIINKNIQTKTYSNTHLSNSPVYQVQFPIVSSKNKTLAYLLVAIPLQESEIVLKNLQKALLVSFPIILVILFFTARYIAGKSIAPINNVIITANRITRENLRERILLPDNKDEIHLLISTINELLNRLEDNLLRERQFTADASHELRTPLSVIKGTLEVLIRKPREIYQYEEKISYWINETDRMAKLIDQLLFLARYDSVNVLPNKIKININSIVSDILSRLKPVLDDKNIRANLTSNGEVVATVDSSMMEIIFENLVSNSIKYSDSDKQIEIDIKNNSNSLLCSIKDQGYGMTEEQIKKIFDRFYRNDNSRNSEIGGFGLGLSIVKKLCEMQNITLKVESKIGSGTSFYLHIQK